MDLYDEERISREGDEYNERLITKLRNGYDMSENEIDKFMNPLEDLAEDYAQDMEIKYHKPQGYYTQEEPNGKS